MRQALLSAILAVLIGTAAYAQTAATVVPVPVFQPLDNNGQVVPGGTVCSYAAGSSSPTATYTDSTGVTANTNPVILDSNGRANIWLKVATKLVFSEPGVGCPSTGVQIWSVDGIAAITKDATFNSVVSSTVFNSEADVNGGNAFQTSTGTMSITGTGNGLFQDMKANQYSYVGFISAPTPPSAGTAIMYYDSTIGALRYNLGGAGWVNISSGVAGSSTDVQYNCSGAFCGAANMTWDNSGFILAITGATTAGVQAPVFSSSNTGTDVAVTDSGANFTILGNGIGNFQSVAVTTGFTANSLVGVTGSTCSHFEGGICTTL